MFSVQNIRGKNYQRNDFWEFDPLFISVLFADAESNIADVVQTSRKKCLAVAY